MKEKISGECPLWNTDIYIESNGNVRSGCWSMEEIGNIKNSKIEEMINSERFVDNVN